MHSIEFEDLIEQRNAAVRRVAELEAENARLRGEQPPDTATAAIRTLRTLQRRPYRPTLASVRNRLTRGL